MIFFQKKPKIEAVGEKKSRQQELLESMVVWGSMFMILFLIAVVLFDDYIYYKVNYRERLTTEETLAQSSVSVDDINLLVEKMDERQRQFEEILGVK